MSSHIGSLPPEQQAIRDRCFHPSGTFIEFQKEDIEQSIPDRFEEQVRRHPHRLAVKTRDHQMTYDELNRAANRVAHGILAQWGEGQEPLALLLEKGPPLIIGILGSLKAGKINIPLDPSHPRVRASTLLKDSHADVILTNSNNLFQASELAQDGNQPINIDDLSRALPNTNPGLNISPDSPAYIIYTSGSTGSPKGVLQNHRNVLHHVLRHTNEVHLCSEDQSLHLGWSGRSMYRVLLNGASDHYLDIEKEGWSQLPSRLIQEKITIFESTASIFRHFVGTLTGGEQFPDLRLIHLTGEQVTRGDVELFQEYFSSDCIFVNRMGSTETGTVRIFLIDKNTQLPGNAVPIGYPVQDVEVLLLDDTGREVGFNQIGEIVVKSRYLSPGYWLKPDLNRATFSPDPTCKETVLYHSGDLGLMDQDGCLFHMGRKDSQIKVRGNRVETAEIEAALLALGDVKDAAVVARDHISGTKTLVAYLVPKNQPLQVSTLRRSLAEMLPSYMLPAVFVMLESLPVTGSGKVDRRALPEPDAARPDLESPFFAPRTPNEQELATIWSEVLDLDHVGIHDNFLELGGDSLLASQVISRVIGTFRVELPLRSLFEAPTVADMAVAITQSQAKVAKPEDIERLLAELEALSAEEAKQLLAEESAGI